LPASVVSRARDILAQLESGARAGKTGTKSLLDELPLFSATPPAPPLKLSKAAARIDDILPDELTPREALNLIYELKALNEEKS
jgi:DNA mismatch repair protein MutS